tara:strand:- start:1184 stop:2170 length:987 start_codon:yes stop_codon:yes gene_type:complete
MNSEIEPTGVLLVNLGTPKSPNVEDVRTYLSEFLSDPDVIRLPRILWLPLLHLIILRIRPKKSSKLYQKIWSNNGSPLLYNTTLQLESLRNKINLENNNLFLDIAMRYGEPSIESKIKKFHGKGIRKILIIPMFPQYSTTTTRSIIKKTHSILRKFNLTNKIFINVINDFHDNDLYINSCANLIKKFQDNNGKPQKLLLSFHGIPKSYICDEEPYQKQCLITSKLIAQKLNLQTSDYEIVFQSRFGKAEWIKPYLAERLKKLPAENIKNIQVFCPGFVADCLETIEEIGEESHDLFLDSKGLKFNFIPCLNNSSDYIEAMINIIKKNV